MTGLNQVSKNSWDIANSFHTDNDSSYFDVIILDHKTPKKDGFQIATEIFSSDPKQRIIIASALLLSLLKELKENLTCNLSLESLKFHLFERLRISSRSFGVVASFDNSLKYSMNFSAV